jgi:outer membrane protein TolC
VLAKSGILKASDIILLEIELLNEDVHITELQSQFSNDLNTLNGLCGLSDTMAVILDSIHIKLNQPDSSGSSFVYQFALDSMIAENSLKISAQKYKPQFSAFVNAGLNAIDPTNIPSNWGFSAGIDLKMNLFDGHQQKINRQQTLIQLETVDNFKRYFIIQRMQMRQNLLKQIESIGLEMHLAEKQLDKYRTLLNIYRQGLVNGDLSVMDYLTVVRTYRKTSDEYLNYNQQIQSAINAYNYWNL